MPGRIVKVVLIWFVVKLLLQSDFGIEDVWFLLLLIIMFTISDIFRTKVECLRKEDEQLKMDVK